jgi:hypothetical protein
MSRDDVICELKDRRAARASHRRMELARLAAHQQFGHDLVAAQPAEQRRLIEDARREIGRWEEKNLCSPEYVNRWRAWLALPIDELVRRMCSPANGWGNAMRQNSPFIIAAIDKAASGRR